MGVPASSTSFTNHYPFSSGVCDWRQDPARSVADADDRAGDDWRDDDDGSLHSWTEGASGREYPAELQVVHREGPREGAGYAYRGTIVGEASNPGPVDPTATCRLSGPGAGGCRAWPGVEGLRTGLVDAGGALLAEPVGKSGCSCCGGLSALGVVGPSPVCRDGVTPLGGAPPPEAGPMGRSRGEGSCAPYGPQRAGPRERARYGYRGVTIGEASHPGPVPAPADHSGVASSGEVHRYTRPTAGGGIGPTRGGGHRQSRGSKASGSGRCGEFAVGSRADPSTPDTPLADGDDGTEEAASRPRRAMSQHLDAGSPVAYAPLGGVAPPSVGVAGDRSADRLGRIAGSGAGDEGLAQAQDEPLLAPRSATDIGDSQRRDGSDDDAMPPVDPRAPSPAPVDDVSMTGFGGDGDAPVPAGDATPPRRPHARWVRWRDPRRRLHARWVRWC